VHVPAELQETALRSLDPAAATGATPSACQAVPSQAAAAAWLAALPTAEHESAEGHDTPSSWLLEFGTFAIGRILQLFPYHASTSIDE
jgi:hypothetical protein